MANEELVQAVRTLISTDGCYKCLFLCGDCGSCVLMGYPPKPEKCKDEAFVRDAVRLVEDVANLFE